MSLNKLREAPTQAIERFLGDICLATDNEQNQSENSQTLESLLNTEETQLLLDEIHGCEIAIEDLKREILDAEQVANQTSSLL
ncbi:hypothetical protein K7432_002479 [Basidiobolus ranarum]|uniref:Uncharacterized protein n=1 Tax=Basidiobolus ranarum TaxID=34480 RepID=A0ABR2X1F5_9FUNG